jgi:uncharacterized membrane-anchored protein YitT (DUF2179 family)
MTLNPKHLYLSVKDDLRSWKWWSSWLIIALGCAIIALGFILFMFPYKITPGGVGGMSVVLHEIFPGIAQGWFVYMISIPLLIAAFAVFGPIFGLKTIFASIMLPFFMLVLPYAVYPDVAVQTAETLLWGRLDLSNDIILATVFGGIMIGVGVGLVVRQQATTAGTDIVSMFLQKFINVKFSNGIFIADAFVVLSSIVVLVGIEGESPTLPLYSLITIYIAIQVIDLVVEGRSSDKVLFIITEKKEEVRAFIVNDLHRGGTAIKGSGLYTGAEREMLFVVVKRPEIVPVKKQLRTIDPAMFVVVVDANETLGQGFHSFADMKTT